MSNVFRQITPSEESAGCQMICDTVDWLRVKGIKLWEKPLPRGVYASRQARGENYGWFVDGGLAQTPPHRRRLRSITVRDVDNLLLIFGDPVAMEFWPATKTREEIAKSIEWIRQEQGVEVAYALAPRHWHRGYATEAAQACRDWRWPTASRSSAIRRPEALAGRGCVAPGTQRGLVLGNGFGYIRRHEDPRIEEEENGRYGEPSPVP